MITIMPLTNSWLVEFPIDTSRDWRFVNTTVRLLLRTAISRLSLRAKCRKKETLIWEESPRVKWRCTPSSGKVPPPPSRATLKNGKMKPSFPKWRMFNRRPPSILRTIYIQTRISSYGILCVCDKWTRLKAHKQMLATHKHILQQQQSRHTLCVCAIVQ